VKKAELNRAVIEGVINQQSRMSSGLLSPIEPVEISGAGGKWSQNARLTFE